MLKYPCRQQMSLVVCFTASTDLDLFGESGAEHHGLSDAFRWHGILLHNTSDLWLKTHVQHAIGLIQNKVAGGKAIEKF